MDKGDWEWNGTQCLDECLWNMQQGMPKAVKQWPKSLGI